MTATLSPTIDRQGRVDSKSEREWRQDGQVISPTPRVENAQYAAMLRRMLKAYGRRVAAGDVEDLADMLALGRELDELVRSTVAQLREQGEASWSDIARAAGTTRQAAQQRWGR